ncbi:MAG: RNA polymerase sigma factor [Bacteroidales bacterium]
MDDFQLAQEISKGNHKAFEDFFEQYKLKVMNLCYGMLHNRDDAEDLVQDIFVELYTSSGKFKGNSKLSTWLYRIAVNKTINHIRKNKIKNLFLNIDDKSNVFVEEERVDLTIEEREKIAELHKFIDKLPSKQKIALTLFVYDELPQKEIAEIMGVSVNSVEVLVFRAKQSIKKLMIKEETQSNI